ncbi:MAG: hypothetical protein ACLGI2_14335 [Acidimicrobiia bacterium]
MLTPRCRNTPAEPESALRSEVAADALLLTAFLSHDSSAGHLTRPSVAELHQAMGYGRARRRLC